MKKSLMLLALAGAVALQACTQEPSTSADTNRDVLADTPLATSEQRLSYGIAYSLGERMKDDGLPLQADAFKAGLADSLADRESRMTEEEIALEMQAYQEQAMAEHAAAQATLSDANLKAAEAFLAENATKEGVVTTESGLQYEVLTEGTGPKPGPDDVVEVHYRGTLTDGTEFDSSYSRGETVTFGVGQVIAGWTEALQLMPRGSTWKLVIPSDLAYGPAGAGQVIGPNAALVFEVELIDIPSQGEDGHDEDEDAAGY